jgi:DeoR family glycerol-3-phosphate regulon repressor
LRAFGSTVAALIPDNCSLFINIGTTTEAVAQALIGHSGLLVITNNLNVANILHAQEKIDVIIAGGPVRRSDGGVTGAAAVDFISQFKVDYAVIGASAIDEDGALLDFDYREVRVSQAIIENSRHVILAADRLKFERAAPIRIGHLSQIQTFVTDALPSPQIAALCQSQGVRVIECLADHPSP